MCILPHKQKDHHPYAQQQRNHELTGVLLDPLVPAGEDSDVSAPVGGGWVTQPLLPSVLWKEHFLGKS